MYILSKVDDLLRYSRYKRYQTPYNFCRSMGIIETVLKRVHLPVFISFHHLVVLFTGWIFLRHSIPDIAYKT